MGVKSKFRGVRGDRAGFRNKSVLDLDQLTGEKKNTISVESVFHQPVYVGKGKRKDEYS